VTSPGLSISVIPAPSIVIPAKAGTQERHAPSPAARGPGSAALRAWSGMTVIYGDHIFFRHSREGGNPGAAYPAPREERHAPRPAALGPGSAAHRALSGMTGSCGDHFFFRHSREGGNPGAAYAGPCEDRHALRLPAPLPGGQMRSAATIVSSSPSGLTRGPIGECAIYRCLPVAPRSFEVVQRHRPRNPRRLAQRRVGPRVEPEGDGGRGRHPGHRVGPCSSHRPVVRPGPGSAALRALSGMTVGQTPSHRGNRGHP